VKIELSALRRAMRSAALCFLAVGCSAVVAAAWAGGHAAAQVRRVGAAPWRRAGHQCVVVPHELSIICGFRPPAGDPRKVVPPNPMEFVQLNAWPPRTLAGRGWEWADSARARNVADSVQRALDARGTAGVLCGTAGVKARVIADEEWRFGGQRVRLYAGYDSVLAPTPRWQVSVFNYASTGDACAEPGAERRVLAPSELAARAREWLYDRLGL
jgi:hypothetical protein